MCQQPSATYKVTRKLLVGATLSGVCGAEDRQGDADPAGAAPLPRAGRQREHATEVLQDGREPMPRLRRVGLYEYHLRPPGWSGSCLDSVAHRHQLTPRLH